MTETPERRVGRPATGVTPKRNVRIGQDWDDLEEILTARGETMTKAIARLVHDELTKLRPE